MALAAPKWTNAVEGEGDWTGNLWSFELKNVRGDDAFNGAGKMFLTDTPTGEVLYEVDVECLKVDSGYAYAAGDVTYAAPGMAGNPGLMFVLQDLPEGDLLGFVAIGGPGVADWPAFCANQQPIGLSQWPLAAGYIYISGFNTAARQAIAALADLVDTFELGAGAEAHLETVIGNAARLLSDGIAKNDVGAFEELGALLNQLLNSGIPIGNGGIKAEDALVLADAIQNVIDTWGIGIGDGG
jgi:hypothetical protein